MCSLSGRRDAPPAERDAPAGRPPPDDGTPRRQRSLTVRRWRFAMRKPTLTLALPLLLLACDQSQPAAPAAIETAATPAFLSAGRVVASVTGAWVISGAPRHGVHRASACRRQRPRRMAAREPLGGLAQPTVTSFASLLSAIKPGSARWLNTGRLPDSKEHSGWWTTARAARPRRIRSACSLSAGGPASPPPTASRARIATPQRRRGGERTDPLTLGASAR